MSCILVVLNILDHVPYSYNNCRRYSDEVNLRMEDAGSYKRTQGDDQERRSEHSTEWINKYTSGIQGERFDTLRYKSAALELKEQHWKNKYGGDKDRDDEFGRIREEGDSKCPT